MVYVINSVTDDDITDSLVKPKSICENIIIIDTSNFLLRNLESYRCDSFNILKQFEVDFPRSTILIDGIKVNTMLEFINYFKFLRGSITRGIEGDILFAMICNQSTYATPYMFLSKYIFKEMILFSDDGNRKISFDYDQFNNMSVTVCAQFKVYDPKNDINVGIVKMNMSICTNIIKNKYWLYFLYDSHSVQEKLFGDNIILSWSFLET